MGWGELDFWKWYFLKGFEVLKWSAKKFEKFDNDLKKWHRHLKTPQPRKTISISSKSCLISKRESALIFIKTPPTSRKVLSWSLVKSDLVKKRPWSWKSPRYLPKALSPKPIKSWLLISSPRNFYPKSRIRLSPSFFKVTKHSPHLIYHRNF